MYSWKQIQREAAEHLLQYRTNQQELISTLKAMKEADLNTVPLEDQDEHQQPIELTEIDPFTFLATFNRNLTHDKLIANWVFLKARWNLQAPVPTDFVGAPILHPQNCWFFGWKPLRQPTDISTLWELAEQVLRRGWLGVTPELFAKCLQIRGVALPKLTTGLFWINPDECLVLNGTTNAYLAEHGLTVQVENKTDYDEILAAVRAKFPIDFITLSHQAYTAKQAEAEGKLTPETLARLWQDFRGLFPDFVSFEEPGVEFAKQELTPKRKALQTLAKNLGEALPLAEAGVREHVRQLVESGKALEALKLLIKADVGNFAAFQSWRKSIGDGDETKVADMLTACLSATAKPIEGPSDLEPIFAATKAHGLAASWDTIGVLLWELSPEAFLPIKISYYRKFATVAGLSLPSGSPTAASLFKLLEFCKLIRASLAPERPRDWVDVQSFIFQLGNLYLKPKAASGLEAPFDQLFTSLPEAESAFDLFRTAMEQLGLTAASAEDKRIALTLPVGSHVLRFNFGNWVVCSWFGSKPSGASFEFVCPSEAMPPCGIKSPEDFAEQVDGQKVSLVKVPVTELPAARPHLDQGLALIKTRFGDWNGSPYRNSHVPALFQMVFDPAFRTHCLQNGLPKAAEPALLAAAEPEPDEEDVATELEPYSIETALQEVFMPRPELEALIATLKRKQNIVLQGPPGVGKTFVAKRLAYCLMGCKDESRIAMVQFHQSYAYEDFVQGYRPDGNGGFAIKPGLLYEFAKKAQANPDQAHFLVIDELNRGNVSKIFGELMLLVEVDKRGAEFAIPLTYSKNLEDKFYLPKNLHLIATMNTADRSLAVVDYALRRRFAFLTLNPAFRTTTFLRHLSHCGLSAGLVEAICTRVEAVNQLIEEDQANLGKGYKLGHSFFVPAGPVADEEAWYLDVVNHEVLPLLSEYWLEDDKRLAEVTELLRRS